MRQEILEAQERFEFPEVRKAASATPEIEPETGPEPSAVPEIEPASENASGGKAG